LIEHRIRRGENREQESEIEIVEEKREGEKRKAEQNGITAREKDKRQNDSTAADLNWFRFNSTQLTCAARCCAVWS
jgi:hypothetical protein